LVMLLVAGVVMASSPAAGDPVLQAIVTLQRCVRVVQCGLILFLLIFSKYLGVSWRQQSFGIALGFGSLAAVELTLVALHASAHLSPVRSSLFNFAAYDVVILIWLTYGLIRAQARVSLPTYLCRRDGNKALLSCSTRAAAILSSQYLKEWWIGHSPVPADRSYLNGRQPQHRVSPLHPAPMLPCLASSLRRVKLRVYDPCD